MAGCSAESPAHPIEKGLPRVSKHLPIREFTLLFMGFRLAVGFLALAPLAMAAQSSSPGASPCGGTATFTPCEMVFELSDADAAKYPDPYRMIDLSVNFRSP